MRRPKHPPRALGSTRFHVSSLLCSMIMSSRVVTLPSAHQYARPKCMPLQTQMHLLSCQDKSKIQHDVCGLCQEGKFSHS